jgi:RNA polymerase sigma factor (sigma-70 family)
VTSAVADRLTHAEERELAARIQAGDRAARDRMVVCNLPLVRMIARKYVGRGLDLDDLVSHGTVGLIGAVDRYDPARGTVFSTFAFMCIKDAIRLALQDECSTIRVPAHIHLMRHAAGKGDPIPDPHDSVAGRLEAADRALGLRSGQGGDGEFDPIASAVAPDEPEPDDSDSTPCRRATPRYSAVGSGSGPASPSSWRRSVIPWDYPWLVSDRLRSRPSVSSASGPGA